MCQAAARLLLHLLLQHHLPAASRQAHSHRLYPTVLVLAAAPPTAAHHFLLLCSSRPGGAGQVSPQRRPQGGLRVTSQLWSHLGAPHGRRGCLLGAWCLTASPHQPAAALWHAQPCPSPAQPLLRMLLRPAVWVLAARAAAAALPQLQQRDLQAGAAVAVGRWG
jgi:hypothetical protein